MIRTKTDRRKAQRKAKAEERRRGFLRSNQIDKAEFLFYEAMRNEENGNLEKALRQLEKAVLSHPKNRDYLFELGRLGHSLGRPDIELKTLLGLREIGVLDPEGALALCCLLTDAHRYADALKLIDEALRLLPGTRVKNRNRIL